MKPHTDFENAVLSAKNVPQTVQRQGLRQPGALPSPLERAIESPHHRRTGPL